MGEIYRRCCNCDHHHVINLVGCLWPGRKTDSKLNTCVGHSEGGDHIVTDDTPRRHILTKDDIKKIRRMFVNGVKRKNIGPKFGVSYEVVTNHIKDLIKAQKMRKRMELNQIKGENYGKQRQDIQGVICNTEGII